MDNNEVKRMVEASGQPVYRIEMDLGMAQGTLAKAVAGTRSLPLKWEDKLAEYVLSPRKVEARSEAVKVRDEVQQPGYNDALAVLLGWEVIKLSDRFGVHHKAFLKFAADKWQAEQDGNFAMAERIIRKRGFEASVDMFSFDWFTERFKELAYPDEYEECAEQIRASSLSEKQKNLLLIRMRQGNM